MEGMIVTKILIHKGLAFIYFIAFLVSFNQFKALCGRKGLLPIHLFLKDKSFKNCPTLFLLNSSDRFSQILSGTGIFLSLLALFGIADSGSPILSFTVWFLLWAIYSSFVNVGQIFYGFGWETMLLEMGFLTIFLGPDTVHTPYVIFVLFQWLLFRNMFGSGLIKLRGDECWKKLTCLNYHFETQPIPNPLSRFAHFLPRWILKSGVFFNHIVEIAIPFLFFMPPPFCYIGGLATIALQGSLIITGNFSWLNYITVVQCFVCFNDAFFSSFIQPLSYKNIAHASSFYWIVALSLFCFIAYLSIRPIKNLLSKKQIMNSSFEKFHIVNTYGAFGSITKPRYELIIEGTEGEDENALWKEYEFKAKPGDIHRRPSIIAPYHLRIDWLMWFAAMSSHIHHPWIIHFVYKLLKNDKKTLKLIKNNPFHNSPPKYIRIKRYIYFFTTPNTKVKSYWQREFIGEYLPPISENSSSLKKFMTAHQWQ